MISVVHAGFRCRAALVFQFPKNYLANADASQVEGIIGQVLDIYSNAVTQQQAAPEATPNTNQTTRDAPVPITVQFGQTVEQVKSVLGQPEKIVNLGAKQIYVYNDFRAPMVAVRTWKQGQPKNSHLAFCLLTENPGKQRV